MKKNERLEPLARLRPPEAATSDHFTERFVPVIVSGPVQDVTLPAQYQAHGGQAVYDAYGLYTSYNGAVTAWAVLYARF